MMWMKRIFFFFFFFFFNSDEDADCFCPSNESIMIRDLPLSASRRCNWEEKLGRDVLKPSVVLIFKPEVGPGGGCTFLCTAKGARRSNFETGVSIKQTTRQPKIMADRRQVNG